MPRSLYRVAPLAALVAATPASALAGQASRNPHLLASDEEDEGPLPELSMGPPNTAGTGDGPTPPGAPDRRAG